MLIVTDCLTERPDEGCLKVAASLVGRLKKADSRTRVISYGKTSALADYHMKLNKLFLNGKLLRMVRRERGSVLYIPNASGTLASAMRVWVLSRFTKKLRVLFALRHPVSRWGRMLLKNAGAQILCLSAESKAYYESATGCQVLHMRTGVDTERFCPVASEEKQRLRQKYGIGREEIVVLHVGHLKPGRNLHRLCKLDHRYHLILVISSNTEPDPELRQKLLKRPNTTLMETYQSTIWEIYQLSDVYVFPVVEQENCIDVPLSVLEAAACGIPAVVTRYGELKEFQNERGFVFPDSLETENLNIAVEEALAQGVNPACRVQAYDWQRAVKELGE